MSENKKSSNGCLVGCLVMIGIVIVLIIAFVGFFVFKGEDILKQVLNQSKDGLPYLLTEDHTVEEKAAFQEGFNIFIDALTEGNIKENVQSYSDTISELGKSIEDRRITRLESTRLLETLKKEGLIVTSDTDAAQ